MVWSNNRLFMVMLRHSFCLNFLQNLFDYKLVMKFFKEFTIKIGKIRLFKNNGHVFRS